MPQDNRILIWLYRIEEYLVVGILLSILIFSALQIITRNIFDSGFVWGETLLRILVLWLGLAGAILASRHGRHISIDILSPYIPENYKSLVKNINHGFTALICLIISYYSFLFVRLEYIDSTMAFEKIPAWLTEAIIPFGFAIIGLKYIALMLNNNKSL